MSQPVHAVLAVLLKQFGRRVEGGGYEVAIPDTALAGLPPFGQIQEHRDEAGSKTVLRYFPNHTIEGVAVKAPAAEDAPSLEGGQ
jgi:hypothetical protein